MVLTIKNRTSYYKRFNLDIWGLVRTGFNIYYLLSAGDTFEEFLKYSSDSKVNIEEKYKGESIIGTFIDYLKIAEKIKEVSKKEYIPSIVPWHVKSRKLSRIVEFFYKNFLTKKMDKLSKNRRYIYAAHLVEYKVRKKRLPKRFISLRLLKLFYITISYRQFIRLNYTVRRKSGNFEENYLLALEGRIISCLYRTSIITSPFQCVQLVKFGYVLINFKCCRQPRYRMSLNKLITFNAIAKRILYISLLERLNFKRSLFNPPKYIYVSFVFLYSYMFRPPRRADLIFPIALDLQRVSKYAF